jgi:hypothetical protein
MDRSRADRTGTDLQPFDIGHYKRKPPGSKMDVLSGKNENFGANRDHVVSGESLKRRAQAAHQDETIAYDQGLTIAIPNDQMHKPHSPTFGGRQASKDKVDGVTAKRAAHDATYPALAFHRDTTTMLERTRDKDHSAVHADFDLSKPEKRIKQVGAYRNLFKASVKMHAADATRGFDPAEPARDVVHTPKANQPLKIGTFSSTPSASGGGQGKKLAEALAQTLKATGRAGP